MLYRFKILFCLLQAFLMLISSFSVYDSLFKWKVDRAALRLTSTADFVFEPVEAEAMRVTEAERARCRAWFEANVLTTATPAYDFTVGGRSLRKHLSDWQIEVGPLSAEGAYRRGGKTAFVTLRHKKSALTAMVEATLYEAYATCEWTVSVKNGGDADSPVIGSFYAADCTLDTGRSDVYFSKGSIPEPDDFELQRSPVAPTEMRFNANGGRTASFLPYFNVSGAAGGVTAAVGWTGQWFASLRQCVGGVRFKAKQEFFRAWLTPGETVRSPLVSLTFYGGDNPVKGFNVFRSWERACVYTESAFPLTCTVLAGEFDRRTAAEYVDQINAYPEETCSDTDYLWRDAGWYTINGDWYDSVGNWTPDPLRFPDGLGPVSDAARARGMGFLLWFEPERCCEGTEVYNECVRHEGWLIAGGDKNRNMVNLANDGACDYLSSLIANAIRENGVGLYRQDFNFSALELWRRADRQWYGGRTGIEENHYVTNLYRFLDTLLAVNPGLIIDNCASGGKRIDLEMSRRSVPLWRSDYNCASSDGSLPPDIEEATQAMTYGLSFWLPLHGTGVGGEQTRYRRMSAIVPCAQQAGFSDVRRFMEQNYFPLIPGGTRTDRWHAMQFGSAEAGAALVYRRCQAAESCRVTFSGLIPAAEYTVYDRDTPGSAFTATGESLMREGIAVTVPEAPGAAVWMYATQEAGNRP